MVPRIVLAGCLFFLLPLSFLSHHVAAAAASRPLSFSFDFSNTSKYRLRDLRFEGDAALNGDLVDLTCNSDNLFCSGRMSYNHPVPLYNSNTGEVASFSTSFSFAIHLWPNTTQKGDGMTFFLSGYPSRLPPGSSSSVLGLTNSSQTIASGADRFVAIKFDTYHNPWDPTGSGDHIGINLNSMTSVSTTRLPGYSLNGTMTASITFDNVTRMLEATLHFDASHSLAPALVKTQLPDHLDALLPPEVAVGFSAATGGYSELHQIHSWSARKPLLCRALCAVGSQTRGPVFPQAHMSVTERQGAERQRILLRSARETSTWANRGQPEQGQVPNIKGGHGRELMIGGVVVLALSMVVVIWSYLSWCRWTRIRDSFGIGSRLRHIEYRDLSIATEGFTKKNEIGRGGFGVVYRGRLKKKQVAVKRILKDSTGEFKDFLAELGALDGTGHGNVVRLEGWCCSITNFMIWWLHKKNTKLFLVYELMPNGNLHQHLHEKPKEVVLPWATRYNIVRGIGSALRYLHHDCKPYILHRDIKPSNILLDKEFNAKLGDFGLSRVAHDNLQTSVQTGVAIGTIGYMDPLCMQNGQVKFRPSSDVYSFGVVLLEIAHGENNPGEVRKLHTDKPVTFVMDVADKKLVGQFNPTEMERVILLGLWCCELDENQRPSMVGAMRFLENGGELRPATPDERQITA